ncbi:6943_t:CDS:2 [Ambispora leptoticha]|uniref:6943_t:CDS:1 n=1 Tax=Ambispora leptoticha TaxID=144679 RepID=A0A9N8V4N9_9GLOM|nr:6943_t:CDS:2 [Ambispora leptoticha]
MQKLIDESYSEDVTFLTINSRNLEGHLDLRKFIKLEKLDCPDNKLTSLDLSKCSNLTHLYCDNNSFTDLDFLNPESEKGLPHPEKLKELYIGNNENLAKQNLSFLIPFTGLEELNIDNCPFESSLEYLKGMKVLRSISISGTDIDSGLEDLPASCQIIYCNFDYRSNKRSIKILKEIELLDNYHELVGLLKTVKIGKYGEVNKKLGILKKKTYEFLNQYDDDGNGTIDMFELQKGKEELAKDLNKENTEGGSQLGEIVQALLSLEREIIEYRQGSSKETEEENHVIMYKKIIIAENKKAPIEEVRQFEVVKKEEQKIIKDVLNEEVREHKELVKISKVNPFLVLITGGAASGKSTLTQKIKENFEQIYQEKLITLSIDSYYSFKTLLSGSPVYLPIYDNSEEKRFIRSDVLVNSAPIIIVEEVTDEIRLTRRLARYKQGLSEGKFSEPIEHEIDRFYKGRPKINQETYIEPVKQHADLVVNNDNYEGNVEKVVEAIRKKLEIRP